MGPQRVPAALSPYFPGLTTLDAARGWVFSPSIQGQNVLAWAADLEAHRPRIAALMKGISAWDKNALDMCGKWPLALNTLSNRRRNGSGIQILKWTRIWIRSSRLLRALGRGFRSDRLRP